MSGEGLDPWLTVGSLSHSLLALKHPVPLFPPGPHLRTAAALCAQLGLAACAQACRRSELNDTPFSILVHSAPSTSWLRGGNPLGLRPHSGLGQRACGKGGCLAQLLPSGWAVGYQSDVCWEKNLAASGPFVS